MVKTYLNWALIAVGSVVLLYVLWPARAGSPEEKRALDEGRVIITYWDRHSGHEHDARRELIEEFNRSQDEVYVRALPVGYDAMRDKLLTSVAGGCPPDICALDGNVAIQLASQGCFMPLDELMSGDPHLSEETFFPHIWRSVSIGGHIYGVPTTTDTYCLLWNKDAFRRAGLDPERPPHTLEELEEYAARLTVQDESGVRQIGFVPWLPWDHTYQWGAMFGGTWYDPETDRFVCGGDPDLLRSLRWQRNFAMNPNADEQLPYALDPERVLTSTQGFQAYMSANNPFYTGKVAMMIEGEWQCTFIPKYAPDLDWGVAPIPTPEGSEPTAYSATCVADCVPTGCRNPEAVFKFLRWFHRPRPDGRPSPSSDYNYAIHNIPVRPEEALQPRFADDPKFGVFVDVVLNRKVISSPITPVTQLMYDEIDRLREQAIYWQTTPEDCLQELEDYLNAELARVRAFIQRSGS